MSRLRTTGFTIILIIIGAIPLTLGIHKLLPFNSEIEPIDTSKYGIDNEPRKQTAVVSFRPTHKISQNDTQIPFTAQTEKEGKETFQIIPSLRSLIVEEFHIAFTTDDIFAVGNPIHMSISAKVNSVENVQNFFIVVTQPNYDFSWLDSDNVVQFVDNSISSGNAVQLLRNSSNTFGREFDITFHAEQDVAILGLIVTEKNEPVKLVAKDKIFTVYPANHKTQIDFTRLAVAEFEQNQQVMRIQLRNNVVMEGLTYVIIAWIPLELATRLWFR